MPESSSLVPRGPGDEARKVVYRAKILLIDRMRRAVALNCSLNTYGIRTTDIPP